MKIKSLLAAVLLGLGITSSAVAATQAVNSGTDGFSYSFSGAGTLSASFSSVFFDITDVLLDGTSGSWTEVVGATGFEQWSFGPTSIGAGNHTLEILGSATGPGGFTYGAYSYTPQVLTAPVPEPETYAMLLAGLGAVGFMSRRRQRIGQS